MDSLNWCDIVWCPGKSPIIAMADYISQTSTDVATKQRLPSMCDEKLCNDINGKIDKSLGYTVPLSVFLIDELISLSPTELGAVKDQSAKLKDGILVYDLESKRALQTAEVPLKPIICEAVTTGLDAIVGRVQTRSGQQTGPPRKSRTKTGSGALKDNGMPPRLNDPAKWEQDLLTKQDEIIEEQVKDIGEYLMPSYARFQKKLAALIVGNDRLSLFYKNFVAPAKYLNINQLNEAVRLDTHYGHIYDNCVQQSKFYVEDKTYVIFNKLLLCKQIQGALEIFKVVLPSVVAFNFLLQTHRHLAHCRDKKLLNEINIRFDIHNLSTLIKKVCKECFICSLNQRQPCGKERQNLPKQPQLIRKKNNTFSGG